MTASYFKNLKNFKNFSNIKNVLNFQECLESFKNVWSFQESPEFSMMLSRASSLSMKFPEEAAQDDVTANDNSNVENEDKVTTNFSNFQKSFRSRFAGLPKAFFYWVQAPL